jgi:MaoC like domain
VKGSAGSPRPAQVLGLSPSPELGDSVGPIAMELSLQRLVMVSGANRDFAMTHIDNVAAQRAGAGAAFADVMFVFTMIDRLLLEWAGPSAVLRRIGPVRLRDFVIAGQELTVSGAVYDVQEANLPDGRAGIDVDVEVVFSQGATSRVTGRGKVWLPSAG